MRNIKNQLRLLLTAILLLSMLTACSSSNKGSADGMGAPQDESGANAAATEAPGEEASGTEQDALRQVEDELGHEIEIPAKPSRIIGTGLEDFLAALDVKPLVRYPYDYLNEWMEDIPVIGYSPGLTPEAALSYDPELIIVGYDSGEEQYDKFSAVAPTYSFVNAWAGNWRDVLRQLGDLLGRGDVAQQKLQQYDEKVAEARERIAETAGAPKLALVYVGKTLWTLSEDRKDVLYGDQGLGLVKPELVEKHGSAEISLELVPELADADYIILEPDTSNPEVDAEKAIEELQSNPLFANLPAVKNGNVRVGMPEIWRGNGPISNSLVVDEVLKTIFKE